MIWEVLRATVQLYRPWLPLFRFFHLWVLESYLELDFYILIDVLPTWSARSGVCGIAFWKLSWSKGLEPWAGFSKSIFVEFGIKSLISLESRRKGRSCYVCWRPSQTKRWKYLAPKHVFYLTIKRCMYFFETQSTTIALFGSMNASNLASALSYGI